MTGPTADIPPVLAWGKKRSASEGRKTLSWQRRERIEFIRRRDDITAYEVARRANIDLEIRARFLSGDRGLRMATADQIAEAFGLSLEESRGRLAKAGPAGAGRPELQGPRLPGTRALFAGPPTAQATRFDSVYRGTLWRC